jgi:hypothetical protein
MKTEPWEKYKGLDFKQKLKLKKKIHDEGSGAHNGTLSATGRLRKRHSMVSGKTPSAKGVLYDVGSGKEWNVVLWDNEYEFRIEVCRPNE